jgi:hypothetical protein
VTALALEYQFNLDSEAGKLALDRFAKLLSKQHSNQ